MMFEASTRTLFPVHFWLVARVLPWIAKQGSLAGVLAIMTPSENRRPYLGVPASAIIETVVADGRRAWRMRGRRCLREGLLAFLFLRLAGYAPVIHFGIEPSSLGVRPRGHCWVTLSEACVLNPPCPDILPLFSWDGQKTPEQVHDHDSELSLANL
jgi:hypothetical protein